MKYKLFYRLLTGTLGSQLRLINTKGTRSNQIAQAEISLIKECYSEKLNMDEVTLSVNMAQLLFYRNFKKSNACKPFTIPEAIKTVWSTEINAFSNYYATTAGSEVGYESPTQLSREYKKCSVIRLKPILKI